MTQSEFKLIFANQRYRCFMKTAAGQTSTAMAGCAEQGSGTTPQAMPRLRD